MAKIGNKMTNETLNAILSWSAVVLSVAIPLLANFFQVRRNNAASSVDEANSYKILQETTNLMIGQMKKQMEDVIANAVAQDEKIKIVSNRVRLLERYIKEYYEGAVKLSHQVRSLGHTPVYTPGDFPKEISQDLNSD